MTLKRPKEFSSIFSTEISAIENISTTALPEPYNNPLQRCQNSCKMADNSTQPMPMAPHPANTEIPYEKRVAIVVLRLLYGHTFKSIADTFQLRKRAVQDIYSRAIERTDAQLRDSFMDVVQNVKDAPRSGRPSRIPPGSEASQ
jgi:hypothetical protein